MISEPGALCSMLNAQYTNLKILLHVFRDLKLYIQLANPPTRCIAILHFPHLPVGLMLAN
jgi:hypothetical protein